MRVDRRKFIALTVGAGAGACRYVVDQARPNLVVSITGLCGLVQNGARSGGLDVLMLDGPGVGLTDMHLPLLLALPGSVVSSTDPPKAQPFRRLTYSSWNLTGYEVSIESDKSGRFSDVDMPRARDFKERQPKEDMFGDVSWIPEMSRLTQNKKATLDKALLGPDPRPRAAARVLFTHGELSSVFPVSPVMFPKIEFKFDPVPPAGSYQQALGDAQVSQLLPSGTVTFNLTPFDKGPQKKITLQAGTTGVGVVEVFLTNLVDPSAHHCTVDDDVQVLEHYKAYYKLLDTKAVSLPETLPIPKYAGGDPLHCKSEDEIIRCGPMRFK